MASRIKEWRVAHDLTQREVCTILQIPRRTLENYEAEVRTPPKWVEDLMIEKLERFDTGEWPID